MIGTLVLIFVAWVLFCLLILWMWGFREGKELLIEFHKFIIRPWKYR